MVGVAGIQSAIFPPRAAVIGHGFSSPDPRGSTAAPGQFLSNAKAALVHAFFARENALDRPRIAPVPGRTRSSRRMRCAQALSIGLHASGTPSASCSLAFGTSGHRDVEAEGPLAAVVKACGTRDDAWHRAPAPGCGPRARSSPPPKGW